jgi:hypothetical protein
MPAGMTYTPLARTTLTSNASSITFSSIPSGYTDLVLVSRLQNANANAPYIRFNGDTGTTYSQTYLEGNGTSPVGARAGTQSFGYLNLNSDPGNNGFIVINFMNYSNTTNNKTYLAQVSNAGNAVDTVTGLWRSTTAINTILLASSNGGNYLAGSTATLYGILAA